MIRDRGRAYGPGQTPRAGLCYPPGHWLRQDDPQRVLEAYSLQQSKAYSRLKNQFIGELLGDLAGKTFLDYGCGPGQFLAYAAKAGARRIVGVDSQATALAAAAELLRGLPLEVDRQLVCSRDLPFRAGANFDVILLKDVIEHLPDDLALLQMAARCLHPRGRLVISTQNAWSLNYLIESLVQRRILGRRHWMGWDPTHLRFYTPPGLAALLARSGLRAEDWRSSYLIPHKLPRGQGRYLRLEFLVGLDRLLGWRRPCHRLGWCLMLSARLDRSGGPHS